MKNLITLTFVVFFAFAFTPNNIGEGLSVDTNKSEITWKGYKVTGEHAGTLKVKSGDLNFTDGKLTGGNFVIDMASLAVTDLKGGMADKLAGHLKSPDFFGTEKFQTATLVIKSIGEKSANVYSVTADLTIKGKTEPVKFELNVAGNTATAALKVNRTKYDIKYGSGSFFDNLGDKTIYDDFDLDVKLTF